MHSSFVLNNLDILHKSAEKKQIADRKKLIRFNELFYNRLWIRVSKRSEHSRLSQIRIDLN